MPSYDVAFSLLSEDEPIAQEILGRFPSTVSAFLYSIRQRELIVQADGLNAFPEVFRQARLCVVLYRDGWGTRPWTRLEERTIADRYMHEGVAAFLFVRLDRTTKLPSWVPTQAFWTDYQAEGPDKVADYILERLNGQDQDLGRVTSRTFLRQPVPIARYQAQIQRATVEHVAIDPEICDACSVAVQYRPIVEVRLPSYAGLPPTSEKLCPRCARDRGVTVLPPAGLTQEDLFATPNPSFRDHAVQRFRLRILQLLTDDESLRALGITNVGAVVAGPWINLVASLGPETIEVPINTLDMQQQRIRYDPQLTEYARSRLKTAVQAKMASPLQP